jgi:hypothetical protein
MQLSRSLAIIAFMAAIAAPLAASAAVTYNFSIPLRLTGIAPSNYEFECAVGGAAVTPPTASSSGTANYFQIVNGSFSGTVTASAQSDTPAKIYTCVMYQFVGNPPSLTFSATAVKVSGSM